MNVFFKACLLLVLSTLIAAPAWSATSTISFTTDEGYIDGLIDGQPAEEGPFAWQTTGVSSQMRVEHDRDYDGDQSYFSVRLGSTNSNSGSQYAISTKRFDEITGVFSASYEIYESSGSGGTEDRSSLALANGNGDMAVWFSTNANSNTSLACWSGSAWVDITTDFTSQNWYSVQMTGNLATGLYDVFVYDMEAGNALVGSMTGLSILNNVTNINTVRLSNEEALVGNAGYYHYYDNLTISSVPVPGAVILLGTGLLGLVGFRRRQA